MNTTKHRLLLEVIERLNSHGSWTGKTHVQKTVFLLDASKKLDMPFLFVLYKHGPYSFDIENELQEMRSYGAIESKSVASYGVTLKPSQNAGWLEAQEILTPDQEQQIEQMCGFVKARNVTELERLATAAWIRTQEHITDPERIAGRLHELKPHISVAEALQADNEIASILGCV
jgi:uncharacterized protein YwgA